MLGMLRRKAPERTGPYYWRPQPDITVYELSEALGVLLPATSMDDPEMIDDMVDDLPVDVRRHFQRMEEDDE